MYFFIFFKLRIDWKGTLKTCLGNKNFQFFNKFSEKKCLEKNVQDVNNHLHLRILGSIEKNILACNNQWNCFKSASENLLKFCLRISMRNFLIAHLMKIFLLKDYMMFFNLMYENIFLKIIVPPSLRVKMRFRIMQVWRI